MPREQENRRIARVLDITWQISRAPRYWTRPMLSERYEVSERMISKDLQIIRHRLLFELEREPGQGYYFLEENRLPAVAYSPPEALALVLAAHSARQLAGVPQEELSRAIARLSSVMPEELRNLVERFASHEPTAHNEHRQRMLGPITQAVSLNRQLEISYASASSGGEPASRRINPYAVIPYGRSWHVIGYCQLREGVRVFKVDRMRSAELLQSTFAPDDEFNLEDFLSEGWGLMRGLDLPVEQVELRFFPPSARWVAEESWHASQQIEWQPDGTLLFTVRIQVTPEFQRWVFRYGREVEILAPASLAVWVRREAEAVLAGLQR